MCILDELYHEWHSPREKPWEGEYEAWDHNEGLWMQAEKVLDAELFGELQRSVMDLMDLEAYHEFEAGFRLGAQLMLDLHLSSAPAAALPAQQQGLS